MSSLGQVSTEVDWAGFNSRTVTVAGVGALDSIVVVNCMCNFASGVSTIGCSTVNDGSAYTQEGVALNGVTGGPLAVEVWRLHNASAGTHNIVLTSNHANSNNFGRIIAFSVPGLQNAVADVVKTNTGTSTTPQTGASAALNQSGEFVVAAMVLATTVGSPAFTSPANTGYTSIMNKQTTGNMPASVDYQHVTSTSAQSANWGTIAGSENFAAILVAWKDVVAGSAPTITSVGTGTIKPGDTSVTISGANFGSQTGSAAVTLIDGSNSALQAACTATSWGASSVQFTVSAGNVRYGPATIQVTTSGGLQATFGVTLAPIAGTTVVTMGTLLPLTFDSNNKPSRLYDSPDIKSGEQLQLSGSGASVTPDGNLGVPTALPQVTFTHHDGTQWLTTSHWDMRGPFPQNNGVLPTQNGVNGAAMSFSVATIFSEADTASLPLTYSVTGASLSAIGLSIASSTGVISGTLSGGAGTFSGFIAQATNADASYVQSAPFSIIVAANTNVTFAGTIPDLPNLTAGQSVQIDTTSYFQNATSFSKTGALPDGLTFAAGIISGTLTGNGITAGTSQSYAISVTGSNANPSSANSPTFTLTVTNPPAVVVVVPPAPPTLRSPQIVLEESASTVDNYRVDQALGVVTLGSTDQPGQVYRVCRIPAAARIAELQIWSNANPAGSLYKVGVLLPNGGGLVVSGSDAILVPSISLDTARTSWTDIYAPAVVGGVASIANVGKRLWELLGFAQDPSPATKDLYYDLVITAVAPGSVGAFVAMRALGRLITSLRTP